MWIDQICIEQGNTDERNHQVKLMSQIYSDASAVWFWLGASGKNSEVAMRYLVQAGEPPCHFPSVDEVSALRGLCSRSYWSRLWIVQEILLARSLVILCGNFGAKWDGLTALCNLSASYGLTSRALPLSLQNLCQLRKKSLPSERPPEWGFITIITQFASRSCLDPRDKVFGLM